MKNVLLTLILAFAFLAGYSQMTVDGNVTVQSGANLVVQGDLTVGNGGDILNDGTTTVNANVTINTGGTYNTSSTGTITFQGTADQTVGGTATPTINGTMVVNNGNNVIFNTGATVQSLTLTSGSVKLGNNNLTATGTISGASTSQYIVTDGTGTLDQTVGGTAVTFPVGNSTYNPITLTNSGTSDLLSVRVVDGLPTNFTATDHVVNRTWEVSEGTAGGSTLDATVQWNNADELTPFDETDAAVGLTADNGTSFAWGASGAATGTDPYTLSGTGFSGVGEFVVGDYFFEGIELDVDLFLAGPYSAGSMSTALNTYIPTTDPYGTSTTVTSVPAGAVDWVKVELRDKTDNTSVLHTFAYFVDANGQLLNTDGTVDAKLTGVTKDQYYIAVNHRNHLGAMTSSTVDLSTSPSFDFTTGTGINGTNPVKDLGSSVFGLWPGDANADGVIGYVASPSDISPISTAVITDPGNPSGFTNYVINGVYDDADVNLDGNIGYVASPSDISPISTSVITHPGNPSGFTNYTITEQIP